MAAYPKILWHYTSLNALGNILKTRTMRATHYRFLNDHAEFQLGCDVVLNHLKKYKGDPEIDDVIKDIKELQAARLLESFYIISFSASPDSLYQWGAYTHKINGGCSIGFNTKVMEDYPYDIFVEIKNDGALVDSPFSNLPHQCVYVQNDSHIIRGIDEFVEEFLKLHSGSDLQLKILKTRLIFEYTMMIKHYGFECEKEYRHTILYKDTVKIKTDTMKPYIELPVTENVFQELITEVMISPHGNKDQNMDYVEFLRKMYNMKFDITVSDIPYRG